MKLYHTFSASHFLFNRLPRGLFRILQRRKFFFNNKLQNSFYCNSKEEQKSNIQILFDLIKRLIRFGYVEDDYFIYGLDKKGSKENSFMNELTHINVNNHLNKTPFKQIKGDFNDYNYICTLRDKYIFPKIRR